MSDYTITPIGTSPAWYNQSEPASGFLLQQDDYRILIDCGSGVIAKYLELYGAETPIDAIVITHIHADHCFDLVPLRYGIQYGPLKHWRPRLLLPPGAQNRLDRLVSAWDDSFEDLISPFVAEIFAPGHEIKLGPFALTTQQVPHFIECFALRFDSPTASISYSSDLGPGSNIVDFVRGSDVLIAEATLTEEQAISTKDRGHLCAREVGVIAEQAGVALLALTHIPAEAGFERALAKARSAFVGPVVLAKSGVPISGYNRISVSS